MVSPKLVCQLLNLGRGLTKIVGHGSLNLIYLHGGIVQERLILGKLGCFEVFRVVARASVQKTRYICIVADRY